MANTVIQVKRSTTTAIPTNLQPGELAYTSNGEVLFIGSVAGSNTANVVAIAGQRNPGVLTANQALVANTSSWIDNIQTAKLIIGTAGTTANITAFTTDGTLAGANVSNSTIASTWAIKDYIDNNSAASLSGLDDVDTTGIANNTYLVYDATASKWEPHTISGTTNEVEVSFSGQNLTIGLPNDVVISGNTNVQGTLLADGNVVLGNNVADIISFVGVVNTAIVPSANVTYSLGTSGSRWQNVYAQEVVADSGSFGTMTVSGNLVVTGDLVTINVATLSVTDPIIHLATNNTVTDTLDIGFVGTYNTGGGSAEHAGLFRDATDGIFKLFVGLEPEPTNTVDTANATYTIATLNAYLSSGALTTNSSTVAITANSTVNVAIVANTLTLSTPLGVSSGGLGLSSLTANSVLTANSTGGVNPITSSTEGHVLQITSGAPTFGMLDGGTF